MISLITQAGGVLFPIPMTPEAGLCLGTRVALGQGLDDPCEPPPAPEIVLDTADRILDELRERAFVR